MLRGSNVCELFADGRLPTSEQQLSAREVLVLEAKALTALEEGDVVIAASAGGAGYGAARWPTVRPRRAPTYA